jgi:hypothetical protein
VFKLLVKLAIVALLANAAYHIGSEYLTYVRFRDAVRDAAMFKAKNNTDLTARIMDLAGQFDVPLDEDNLTISREDRRVNIDGWYDKPIEVVPNYEYPWHFGLALEIVAPPTSVVTP